ncbi:Serine/threonine-protein kinase plk1 [Balamuthia mandrillaris]
MQTKTTSSAAVAATTKTYTAKLRMAAAAPVSPSKKLIAQRAPVSPSKQPPARPVEKKRIRVVVNKVIEQQRSEGGSPKKYLRGPFLGKGGFAHVYEVTAMDTGVKYAAKVVPKASLEKTSTKQKLVSEIKLHHMLRHKHIVRFHCFFEDQVNVYILMELCENKSMMELIRQRKTLTEEEARYYLLQMLDALAYMHSRRIIHRDLKLGNMLLNKNMEVKIGDFGLATRLANHSERRKTVCGTPNYIAPEILNKEGGGHSYQADIWSLGVILYTWLVGTPPFETSTVEATYAKIRSNSYNFPADCSVSPAAKTLIQRMLHPDPESRPSLCSIQEDAFMTQGFLPLALTPAARFSAPQFDPSLVCSASSSVSSSASALNNHNNKNENKNEHENNANKEKVNVQQRGEERGEENKPPTVMNQQLAVPAAATSSSSSSSSPSVLSSPFVSRRAPLQERTNQHQARPSDNSLTSLFDNHNQNDTSSSPLPLPLPLKVEQPQPQHAVVPSSPLASTSASVMSRKRTRTPTKSKITLKSPLAQKPRRGGTSASLVARHCFPLPPSSSSSAATSTASTATLRSSNNNRATAAKEEADGREEEKKETSLTSSFAAISLRSKNEPVPSAATANAAITSSSSAQAQQHHQKPLLGFVEPPSSTKAGSSSSASSSFLASCGWSNKSGVLIYVSKWMDYSSKYGLAYQLCDGTIGAYFNDYTKLAFLPQLRREEEASASSSSLVASSSLLDGSFSYYKYQPANKRENINNEQEATRMEEDKEEDVGETHQFSAYPSELRKKVTLAEHFYRGFEDARFAAAGTNLFSSSSSSQLHQNEGSKPVHVTKWMRTKHAILFKLSDGTFQVCFFDGAVLLVSSNEETGESGEGERTKRVVYVARSSKQWKMYPDITSEGFRATASPSLLHRMKYLNDVLSHRQPFSM